MKCVSVRLVAAGAIALALAGPCAVAQPENSPVSGDMRCFNGYAYTRDGGQYRYTEHHEQHLTDGRITTWDIDYVGRGGNVIATKHMDFSANPTVPVYTLKIPADGYEEGIRHDNGAWTMFREKSRKAKPETKSFKIDPPMAADSGFNALVRRNYERLASGRELAFKFVVAGRMGVVNLKASKTGTTQFEGNKADVFSVRLDMFLINHFVDSLKLTYDPHSHRLLEYRGIGNIHDQSGKVYPVRVTYPSRMPAVANRHGAPRPDCGSLE